jgi:hypothetical protein
MSTAIWIRVLAQATILPNWIAGFSALVPFSLVSFLRVEKEERMMVDAFGTIMGNTRDGLDGSFQRFALPPIPALEHPKTPAGRTSTSQRIECP